MTGTLGFELLKLTITQLPCNLYKICYNAEKLAGRKTMLQPSIELQEAVCEDAGRIFNAHVARLPLDEIYASVDFERVRRRFLKEFPESTDQEVLTVILYQYAERLKTI